MMCYAPMLVSIWGLQETVIKIFGCQSKPNGLALYSSNHSRVAEKMFFGERDGENRNALYINSPKVLIDNPGIDAHMKICPKLSFLKHLLFESIKKFDIW